MKIKNINKVLIMILMFIIILCLKTNCCTYAHKVETPENSKGTNIETIKNDIRKDPELQKNEIESNEQEKEKVGISDKKSSTNKMIMVILGILAILGIIFIIRSKK